MRDEKCLSFSLSSLSPPTQRAVARKTNRGEFSHVVRAQVWPDLVLVISVLVRGEWEEDYINKQPVSHR